MVELIRFEERSDGMSLPLGIYPASGRSGTEKPRTFGVGVVDRVIAAQRRGFMVDRPVLG